MKKAFTPEAVKEIKYLSEPAAAPDGTCFAYVQSQADETLQTFTSEVYLIDRQTGKQTNLDGAGSQKSPAFSPDGQYLAYLSDESGELQIWLHERKTGACSQLTMMRHGVENFTWSPDGASLVFECKGYPDEVTNATAYAEMRAEGKTAWTAKMANSPVEITEIMYKWDGEGLLDGSLQMIGVCDIRGGRARLISADMPGFLPVWSRDGGKLAFYSRPYTGVKAMRRELFICNADGSDRRQLSKGLFLSAESPPCFTKDDGAVIADVYPELPDGGMVQSLYRFPLDGGEPCELFSRDAQDYLGINGMPVSHTVYGQASPLFRLGNHGENIYYLLAAHGSTGVFKLDLRTKQNKPVISGAFSVQSFCLTDDGGVLYTRGDPGHIAELFFNYQQLTRSNDWLNEFQIAPVQELMVPTRDGEAEIQGWVMYPAFRVEGKRYPAVLDIRGGPEATSTADFWHEYQALAGAGIAVLYCNPRGSLGYGPKFMQNNAAWDKAPDDFMDFVNAAVKLGFIDDARIGVTGGSYGGYMTNKLICESDTFAAAAAQRTLCNLATSYGTGDIGFISAKGPVDANFRMLNYLKDRAKRSLICRIDDIQVPVLLLHGYQDYRCSFEQAEQFFVTMKDRHPEIPVRLVMFPDEDHGITRAGTPANQIRHLSELVNWFRKYLIDEPWKGAGGGEA